MEETFARGVDEKRGTETRTPVDAVGLQVAA